jgi:hypothetical protein
MRLAVPLLLCTLSAGCVGDLDPAWQLDHDRVVAVRATPPSIPAGQAATFDALIAHKGAATSVEAPMTAKLVLPPAGLENVLGQDANGAWTVTAPDDATLAAARTALMLDPAAPVPVLVGMTFDVGAAQPLVATKIVQLGASATNPAMPAVTVAGAPIAAPVVVPAVGDTYLAVPTPPTTSWMVNWFTSASALHDDGEATAFLRLETKNAHSGELAVVIRDPDGGVVWQVWPISVQ